MSSPNLIIEAYSEKSFVVRGDSKPYSSYFKERKGRWNPRLQGGPGWIFSYGKENSTYNEIYQLVQDINEGKVAPIESPTSPRTRVTPTPRTSRVALPTGFQTVSWVIHKPAVNEEISLVSEGNSYRYKITEVQDHDGIVDIATIQSLDDPNFVANLVIVNGQWQVYKLVQDHTVEFVKPGLLPSTPSVTLPPRT